MIEVVNNDYLQERNGTKVRNTLPKNVRQIGRIEEHFKVYIEDYVVTFLNQLTSKDLSKVRAAVLCGEVIHGSTDYLFISGAIYVEEIQMNDRGIQFNDMVWRRIYENMKEYFDTLEVVGWCISVPGYPVEMTAELRKTHINHFSGKNKIVIVKEPISKEEGFFYYEEGRMKRLSGYYVYYERNRMMQTYMIEHNPMKEKEHIQREEEINSATRQFRNIVKEKSEQNQKRNVKGRNKKTGSLLYSFSSLLIIVVLIIGITMMNNYDKMKQMEESLSVLTKNSVSQVMENQGLTISHEENNETDNEKMAESQEEETQIRFATGNVEENQEETQEVFSNEVVSHQEESVVEEEQMAEASLQETEENLLSEKENVESEPSVEAEESQPAAETSEERQEAEETERNYYVVQEGDTLAQIAIDVYHNKRKVEEICKANNIDNVDKIFVGQKILLP